MDSLKNIKRVIDVGAIITGIGARVGAQQLFGMTIDDAEYAQKLRLAFGNLKGPFMKIVQFMATIPDALPPEFAEEFLNLQSNAPSMGESFVNRRMSGELGADWRLFFDEFNSKAVHAASLGQVHKAIAKNGDVLALKLQYPDMNRIVESDLKQLDTIIAIYKTFNKSLHTEEIIAEIRERLLEELDYENEAQNIELFRHAFADLQFVKIPNTYKAFSTKRLLAMEWIAGENILNFQNADTDTRNDLGKKLFQAWYHPLYKHHLIHADPHPGNYLVTKNHQLALLDFGCVRKFEPSFLQAVVDLYKAQRDNLPELAVDAYKRWGFSNLNNEIIDVLNIWANLLYEPLLDNNVRPLHDENGGKKGFATLRLVHKKLHELGGIKPPKEFVFMDRCAVGVGSVIMRLGSQQNWHKLFEDIAQGYL
jgi:predicted unusual protein kinase regulating ubiquinone biosynthesis (AarF/ABC1/UbiB family)